MQLADSGNLDGKLIERLREAIDGAMDQVLGAPKDYALVDFPDHSNVGDSAIWLGEIAWLEARGFPSPACVCTRNNYDPVELRSSLPEGPILIHGGGNFGDLWPAHQEFRERICMDFPDRPIIQLPQSVHFDSRDRAAKAQSVFSARSGVTLLARDHQSQARLKDFGCRVVLCPDMAFCLGELLLEAPPHYFVTTLFRDDKESAGFEWARNMLAGIYNSDWLDEEFFAVQALQIYLERREGRFQSYRRIAEYRLARGMALLSKGYTVITDRLHAHILCILLGKPHLALDNSYGKIGAFTESWTSTSRLGSRASGPEQVSAWLKCQELRIMSAGLNDHDADPAKHA